MRTRSACVDPVRIGGGGEDSSRHPSVQGGIVRSSVASRGGGRGICAVREALVCPFTCIAIANK